MPTEIEHFNQLQLNNQLPSIRPGDTVKVHQKIKESSGGAQDKGDPSAGSGQVKERIQIFEGVVIARKHGKGISSTITVRKVVEGVGVERIFPVHSPSISKIEVVKSGKVRRSKLYYLREAKGKKSRLKKKEFAAAIAEPEEQTSATTEAVSQTPIE